MTFVDLPLSQRIEAAQAQACVAYAHALTRLHPDRGAAVEAIAGGYAVFAGVNSPITQATGVGMAGPVENAEMERLEAFSHGRGSTAKVVYCPMADLGVAQWLGRRAYYPVEFENVLFRPLDRSETPAPPASGITVQRSESHDLDAYARVMSLGFFDGAEVGPEILDLFDVAFQVEGSYPFLAFLDGQPIAGAGVSIHAGLATLTGASTVPAFRNRGAHTALHHARLAFAAELGCDLAVVNTNCGSTSQRNAERRGFRVAYTRVGLAREPS